MVRVERIGDGPIVHAGLCETLGDNINGPSLIARPGWAPGPGRYMLYFAHHKGRHIRLATADVLRGPWTVHRPGVLPLAVTPLAQERPGVPQPAWAVAAETDGLYPHLASPDVRVDDAARRLEMWFHGLDDAGEQVSYRARSADGMDWRVTGPPTDQTYLRVFEVGGEVFAMALGGVLMRLGADGVFRAGAEPIARPVRHVAVLVRGPSLHVLYTCRGDAPERILHTTLDLSRPWPDWPVVSPERELLRPERDWEGAGEPVTPSMPGATGFANQLRDPALYEENGALWLVYAGGGEAALGLARIEGL